MVLEFMQTVAQLRWKALDAFYLSKMLELELRVIDNAVLVLDEV